MFLYHLPLLDPSNVPLSALGSFVDKDREAVVFVRGASLLEYLELDLNTGQLVSCFTQDVFATVRSVSVLRPMGSDLDLLVMSSDSGFLSFLRVDREAKQFIAVHQAMLGRSGCRRTIAGDRVVADAQGRAVMVAALERQHFCIAVQVKDDGSYEWSSPLEAHRNRVVCVDLVALRDVAKPTWAAIELDYGPVDEAGDEWDAQQAAQGKPTPAQLHHPAVSVTPKLTLYELDVGLNHVRRVASRNLEERDPHKLVPLPHGGLLVIYKGKMSMLTPRFETVQEWNVANFIQTATVLGDQVFLADVQGNLLKLVENDLSLYDKVEKRPCALLFFKAGFLLVLSEQSDHLLYQVQDTEEKNLVSCGSLENRGPVCDAQLIGDTWWLASLDALHLLTPGHAPEELSRLDGRFTAVHQFGNYILLTPGMLLKVGESDLEEAQLDIDLEAIHVLAISSITEEVAVQVLPTLVRSKHWQWQPETPIAMAVANERQVALYLSSGMMIYLEIGEGECRQAGQTPPLPEQLTCLAMAPLPAGRQRSRWLAVGSEAQALRLLSCDPQDCLEPHSLQVQGSVLPLGAGECSKVHLLAE